VGEPLKRIVRRSLGIYFDKTFQVSRQRSNHQCRNSLSFQLIFAGVHRLELQGPMWSFLFLWRSGSAMSFSRISEGGIGVYRNRASGLFLVVDIAVISSNSGYRLFDRSSSKYS
jgi:hypothetical protein